MSNDRRVQLKAQMLDEAVEQIESLHGADLEKYLLDIGMNPDDLVQQYKNTLDRVLAADKRAKFEEAKRFIQSKDALQKRKPNVVTFDLDRKRKVMELIKAFTDRTSGMTVAARNRRIEAEEDLNTFLEASVALGIIDEEGNIIE